MSTWPPHFGLEGPMAKLTLCSKKSPLDLDSVSSLFSWHSYFHCNISPTRFYWSLHEYVALVQPWIRRAQRSSLIHFYIPSTEQASSWCSVVFVELIDWFMASPLGPPPSGHCKCENSWVILGLQSNDLSWSCKGSLLKDLREILHATYARLRCRQKRILLISFHNRLLKLRLPIMLPTGSLPGSIRTLALLCMALKESRAVQYFLFTITSSPDLHIVRWSVCAIFLPYVEIKGRWFKVSIFTTCTSYY